MDKQHLETYNERSQAALEKARKMAKTYRHVFASPEGQLVLTDILNDLHYWDCEDTSPGVVAKQQAAKMLLAKMLVVHPANVWEMTSKLLEVPIPSKENM